MEKICKIYIGRNTRFLRFESFLKEKKLKRGVYSDIKVVDLGNKELIFVAGQIARDENGAISPGNIEAQTEFIFQSIEKILIGVK